MGKVETRNSFVRAHYALGYFLARRRKKALELLKNGYKGVEVSKIVGIYINTHYQGAKAGACWCRFMIKQVIILTV
jgi:hypothetical protein